MPPVSKVTVSPDSLLQTQSSVCVFCFGGVAEFNSPEGCGNTSEASGARRARRASANPLCFGWTLSSPHILRCCLHDRSMQSCHQGEHPLENTNHAELVLSVRSKQHFTQSCTYNTFSRSSFPSRSQRETHSTSTAGVRGTRQLISSSRKTGRFCGGIYTPGVSLSVKPSRLGGGGRGRCGEK